MPLKDTVVLATEEINETGGIEGQKIKLIIRDDMNDPDTAKKADKELIDEGVVAIIGHITSSMTKSVLTMMNENDMLLLPSPATSTKSVIEIDDNMISLCPSNMLEQQKLIDYFISEPDIGKIVIILDKVKIFSSGWVFDENIIYNGGKAVENLIIPVSWDYDSDHDTYHSFKEKFYGRYGRYPNYT